MKHALGKTPDSRHDLVLTLNRAGRALTTRFSWSWRMHASATITGTASQNYIGLPAAFAQLVSVTAALTSGYTVGITTIDDIERMRAEGSSVAGGIWWLAFGDWAAPVSSSVNRVQRVAIYPTPATGSEPSFTLKYKAKWVDFAGSASALTSGATGTTLVPNIPDEFESALIHKCRALAMQTENRDGAQLEETLYEAEVQRLILEEANQQPTQGRMRGGADDLRMRAPILMDYATVQGLDA